MQAFCDRSFIESQLQCLNPTKYNRYYWWRRYQTRDPLSDKTPLYEKIAHGDYDASDYLFMMEHEFYLMEDKISTLIHPDEKHDTRGLFMERIRRLNEDYRKDEQELMKKLYRDFRKTFNIQQQDLIAIMQDFEGNLLELYSHIKSIKKPLLA